MGKDGDMKEMENIKESGTRKWRRQEEKAQERKKEKMGITEGWMRRGGEKCIEEEKREKIVIKRKSRVGRL